MLQCEISEGELGAPSWEHSNDLGSAPSRGAGAAAKLVGRRAVFKQHGSWGRKKMREGEDRLRGMQEMGRGRKVILHGLADWEEA